MTGMVSKRDDETRGEKAGGAGVTFFMHSRSLEGGGGGVVC